MAPVGPPEPFLDRPGSPPVPWVQWIREFSLFLDQERYAEEEDKSRTLLRHLGQEGCRVLCSVLDPNGTPTRTRTQTGTQTRTWTYEEMVSALTKHYDTKKRNSKMYTAAAVGGAAFFGLGAVAAAPFVLAGIGFTSAGIAAGSYAAGMMSSAAIANGGAVAAGSLVAVLQSAAFSLSLSAVQLSVSPTLSLSLICPTVCLSSGAAGLSAGASAVVGGVGAAVGGAVGALVIGADDDGTAGGGAPGGDGTAGGGALRI